MSTPARSDYKKTLIAANASCAPVLNGAPPTGSLIVAFVFSSGTTALAAGINNWTKQSAHVDSTNARGSIYTRPQQPGDTASLPAILTTNLTTAAQIHTYVYTGAQTATFFDSKNQSVDAVAGVVNGPNENGTFSDLVYLVGACFEDATLAPSITVGGAWTLDGTGANTTTTVVTSAVASIAPGAAGAFQPTFTNTDTLTNQHGVQLSIVLWASTVTLTDQGDSDSNQTLGSVFTGTLSAAGESDAAATDATFSITETLSVAGESAAAATDATVSLSGSESISDSQGPPSETVNPYLSIVLADSQGPPSETENLAGSISQSESDAAETDATSLVSLTVPLHDSQGPPSEALGMVAHVTDSGDSAAAADDTTFSAVTKTFGEGIGTDVATSRTKPQTQVRTFSLQVFRIDSNGQGNWVDINTISAEGSIGKDRGGTLKVKVANKVNDPYRSRLYEGEKIRAYRGIIGQPQVRCWTGYVDAPTGADEIGVSREFVCTDNIKELVDAILLEGVVYDTFAPNAAAVDVIKKAISSEQFVPTNDAGALLSSTANYNLPNGNKICYFPDILNFDGTDYTLASGTLGSFTQGDTGPAYGTLMVPPASGVGYSAFELPNQYLIASTVAIHPPFSLFTGGATNFPPPSGTVIVDCYNGIFYFNPHDASKTVSFSAFYYSTPLWAYPPGTKCGDVISEIMDKTGSRYFVDGFGKFQAFYIDSQRSVKRVFAQPQYKSNSVQTNRDRRNVVVCEGWNGFKSTLIVSKATNLEDINNPPPKGLGKRAYVIAQDQTWVTQKACNNAAYFGIFQLSRRGKVATMTIIDDPNLFIEDVIGFSGTLPEIGDGDLFFVEQIDWKYAASEGKLDIESQVTGTMMPSQGTFMVGAPRGATEQGQYDFTTDVTIIRSASLSPKGGTFHSVFNLAADILTLHYVNLFKGLQVIDLYGSSGDHVSMPHQTLTSTGSNQVTFDPSLFVPNSWYSVRLKFIRNDNIGGAPPLGDPILDPYEGESNVGPDFFVDLGGDTGMYRDLIFASLPAGFA